MIGCPMEGLFGRIRGPAAGLVSILRGLLLALPVPRIRPSAFEFADAWRRFGADQTRLGHLLRCAIAYARGMRISRVALALVSLVPLAGCYHWGELGNLGFELGIADVLYEFESGDRVLVGTRMCPTLGRGKTEGGDVFLVDQDLACFDETITGPAQFDAERCWSLTTPGEVIWELTPNDTCDLPSSIEFSNDRIRVEVVEPSGPLRLGFDDWRARVPLVDESWSVVGLAPGRTLADLREDSSAPRRVVAGQLDVPMFRLDDDLGRLYFAESEPTPGIFELVGAGGTVVDPAEPIPPEEYATETRLGGERPLVLEPGATIRVRANLPGGLVVESPELIAVPPSEAASLDLMVVIEQLNEPVFAFAEVRDAQGRVLHAPAVEWSVVEGALSVYPGGLDTAVRTGEYMEVHGDCEPLPETEPAERHAVLRARLGALEDTVDLVWTVEPPEHPSTFPTEFEPDPNCMVGEDSDSGDPGVDEGGCACSSTGDRPSAAAAWLALVGLLGLRLRPRLRLRGCDD